MVVPHKALQPRWKSANVSTDWLAQVAVSARPKRNGVMMRCRRQNFSSVPQALSRGSENTHWNLSATRLSCPWSIWNSFRCLYSNTHKRSFGWITIKIHNKIKYLKVPTYDHHHRLLLDRLTQCSKTGKHHSRVYRFLTHRGMPIIRAIHTPSDMHPAVLHGR